MRRKKVCFFAELDVSALRDCLVALDIDGTLGPHGCEELAPGILQQIAILVVGGNLVRLVSNNTDSGRAKRLAAILGVEVAESAHYKPDPRALGDVPEHLKERPLVVIGDKVLTDGRFAKRLGARFYKVKIVRSDDDPWSVRTHYALDWLVRPFFRYTAPGSAGQ